MGKSSGSVNVLIGATRTRGEEVGLGEESSRVVRFTQDKLVANSPKDSAEYVFVARGRCVGGALEESDDVDCVCGTKCGGSECGRTERFLLFSPRLHSTTSRFTV